MAIQTEQDKSIDPDAIRIIAIKLPFDLQERVHTFPFLHALRDYYPEAEFHFITPKKNIEVLNLLPFTAFYHEFDDGEIKTVFDVHRFCAHMIIGNVDLFICLTNSFVDACLGIALRAKRRLGFGDGWKGMILTEKINRPIGHHFSEDFNSLYNLHTQKEVNTRLRVTSRELPLFKNDLEDSSYLAINLYPLRESLIADEWRELVGLFENQNIVFFTSDEIEKILPHVELFMKQLPPHNQYSFAKTNNWIELGKLFAHARGVISYEGATPAIATYTGAQTIALYDREDAQKFGPFYFMADVMVCGVNDPTLVQTVGANKNAGQVRKVFDMHEIYSRAVDFFKLAIKKSN